MIRIPNEGRVPRMLRSEDSDLACYVPNFKLVAYEFSKSQVLARYPVNKFWHYDSLSPGYCYGFPGSPSHILREEVLGDQVKYLVQENEDKTFGRVYEKIGECDDPYFNDTQCPIELTPVMWVQVRDGSVDFEKECYEWQVNNKTATIEQWLQPKTRGE